MRILKDVKHKTETSKEIFTLVRRERDLRIIHNRRTPYESESLFDLYVGQNVTKNPLRTICSKQKLVSKRFFAFSFALALCKYTIKTH